MAINADPPSWLSKWRGDGVLVRAETKKMVRAIQDLGLPVIDLRCWRSAGTFPGFDTDPASVIKLAVDHLRDRGFTQFGFCGFGGANYSDRRLSEMQKYVRALGHDVVSYMSPGPTHATTFDAEQSGMLDQKGLERWL
jgi:LacI family transcriptional regulator